MERETIRAILLVTSVLFSLCANSSANYKKCFNNCYHQCRDRGDSKVYCKYMCVFECLTIPSSELNPKCGFSCANLSCGHLDREVKDIVVCLDNCSANCTKPQRYPC